MTEPATPTRDRARADSQAYDLVIFDCDGVLIDSERLAVRFDAEIFAKYGWPLSEREIADRYLGRTYDFMIGELVDHVGPLPEGFDEEYRRGVHDLFERELVAVDGVTDAIDAIRAAGLATCVASSSGVERLRISLGLTGLYGRFEGRIFSATHVEHGKPAPDLFLYAARQLGVEPERCAVVEDSEFGVQAARAAGMSAYGFVSGLLPRERLAGPGTTLFTDMRALPDLLGLGTTTD